MLEWAQEANAIWQYVVLFLLGAAPWMDVSIIVPLGVLWGLSPVGVGLTAFIGNFLLIVLLGLFFKQIAEWRTARRQKKGITSPTKRETRSREIWDKYGIPGLALLAPILVGTDIAAILALTFGSSKSTVVGWMAVSLALWTIVFVVASMYGFSFLNVM
ncbi:small multi-drug export protein [Domibacillus sp. 8LH]|uniref:small multi-drug export protein n=1 Tax=Domibacillus sp. 8LH TaxID=3073900 RepID=UPI003181DEE6